MLKDGGDTAAPGLREADDRLDSWKEIARHLRRDVKTVQRWEAIEGLPVRRHVHGKRATAYAYRSEVDAWLAARDVAPSPSPDRVATRAWRYLRGRPAVLGVSAAVLAMLVFWGVQRWSGRAASSPFDPIWVLPTTFENRTGTAFPEDLARQVLVRELADSRSLNVVPAERIGETLTLMVRPPDTQLDLATALEIAERDGAVRAIVRGVAEASGTGILLTIELRQPENGSLVGAAMVDMADDDALVAAVREASRHIRRTAEERLGRLPAPARPLERATTRSLAALRAYSEAISLTLGPTVHWDVVERRLRDALAEDGDFASAHIMLGWAAMAQTRMPETYRSHVERAVALAGMVSPREAYFIRGSDQLMAGNFEAAARELQVLVDLFPDDYWAVQKLGIALYRLGREEQAALTFARAADLRPSSLLTNARVAILLAENGHIELARRYQARARAPLSESETLVTRQLSAFWRSKVEMIEVHTLLKRGDTATALAELGKLRDRIAALEPDDRSSLAQHVVNGYASLGQLRQAEELTATWLAPLDLRTISDWARKPDPSTPLTMAPKALFSDLALRGMFAARGRDFDAAEYYLEQARASLPALPADSRLSQSVRHGLQIVEGEILRLRGESEAAESLLSEAVSTLGDLPLMFLGAESLAMLREAHGDIEGAMEALKQTGADTPLRDVAIGPTTPFWTRNRFMLARLLRGTDPRRAAAIEAELRQLLAGADEDHLVASMLRESESAYRSADTGPNSAGGSLWRVAAS